MKVILLSSKSLIEIGLNNVTSDIEEDSVCPQLIMISSLCPLAS